MKGWRNITDEVPVDRPPWTWARDDGVGALQITAGIYESGPVPDPSPEKLLEMVSSYVRTCSGQDEFVRAWYVSNGYSFAQVTYICAWGEEHAELPACERMVTTLRFEDGVES